MFRCLPAPYSDVKKWRWFVGQIPTWNTQNILTLHMSSLFSWKTSIFASCIYIYIHIYISYIYIYISWLKHQQVFSFVLDNFYSSAVPSPLWYVSDIIVTSVKYAEKCWARMWTSHISVGLFATYILHRPTLGHSNKKNHRIEIQEDCKEKLKHTPNGFNIAGFPRKILQIIQKPHVFHL